MSNDAASNDAALQAAPQRQRGGSFARLKTWAGEKPWHMWALILIGLATLYLMYRIWQSNQAAGSSGGFFAGLAGAPNTGPASPTPTGPTGPTVPTHWWDTLLHSKGNQSDTDLTDPANAAAEGYATVGAAGVQGTTLAQLAAFFRVKVSDLLFNPNNKGLPSDPNAQLASGTEVWITRSTMQS